MNYLHGHVGYASDSESSDDTRLGEERVAPMDEVRQESQFKPYAITKTEFERIWSERVHRP